MAELGFNRFDAAIFERGPHLKPSQVVADVTHAANQLRIGPGLTPAAFSVEIEAASEEEREKHFRAVCRLARISAVPLITVPAAPIGTPVDDEVKRLTRLTMLGQADGIQIAIPTVNGTLTEEPAVAELLCKRVPGLALTLDPSHYLIGPYQGKGYDGLLPFVRHLWLRDTGKGPNQFQVRIGQGAIEYGRILSQLSRHRFDRALVVDIRDIPDSPFAMEPEVRKLKYLLESLV
jgi:sugar phosphate isomerase/epimerase